MIESSFYSALSAAPAVTALVQDRIFPFLVKVGSALPAIDYSIVTSVAEPTFTTRSRLRTRMEVNCWGASYNDAVTLREAVMQALDGYRDANFTCKLLGPRDLYDHDLLQYRASVEFYLFSSL